MNANRTNNLWCKKCLWYTCRCAFQFPPSEQMCEADFVGGLPLRHQYRQTMTMDDMRRNALESVIEELKDVPTLPAQQSQWIDVVDQLPCPACGDFRIVEKTSQRCQACETEFTAAPEQAEQPTITVPRETLQRAADRFAKAQIFDFASELRALLGKGGEA